jgi:DNA-binding NarL/FixJ family response regulator
MLAGKCIMTNKRRILIVDDHPVVLEGLKMLINRHDSFEVCGEAMNATAAMKEIRTCKPDLAIVDISLEGKSGIELVGEIRQYDPKLPVLVLSMYSESLFAERALRAGARGYIMKKEMPEVLINAIGQVLDGEIYLSKKMTTHLFDTLLSRGKISKASPFERLTDREYEVFQSLGKGLTTQEIGEMLHLSKNTIETYRERIREKLGLKDSRELLRYSIQWMESDTDTYGAREPQE